MVSGILWQGWRVVLSRLGRVLSMPSVMGLLEDEERAARQRVEVLREQTDRLLAELHEAETDWQELVISQRRVSGVLAGQYPAEGSELAAPVVSVAEPGVSDPAVAAEGRSAKPVVAARPGSIVPRWRAGFDVRALAVEHQRILAVLAEARSAGQEPMACKEIAQAMGIELTPSKIEGVVRSRARRLAERGWLQRTQSGKFRLADGPAAASSA
ncbi:hypothetical protein ABZV67_40215 [Streptomyces sp. NPDC005065]|uniref:hypothetical protein n=1 Tax=Streptomyces sp. NPDC005065 TaxID=3154461 RepID=UPI0033AC63DF